MRKRHRDYNQQICGCGGEVGAQRSGTEYKEEACVDESGKEIPRCVNADVQSLKSELQKAWQAQKTAYTTVKKKLSAVKQKSWDIVNVKVTNATTHKDEITNLLGECIKIIEDVRDDAKAKMDQYSHYADAGGADSTKQVTAKEIRAAH